ncbi:hypothetical protein G6F46_012439 [Rhizopus delemar]|uniref:Tc1-like transposase DDE domain-containing protein n=2 Tax=Rhizopus TaxID=4842 RepID=A0A9P6YS19_9FUNG|nr:hypothetical protein G6F55_012050 [Rhizopus delemar]KAG1533983.1 hypothetical protein G6F51_012342 [Rhizopus arrhizus]KAG1488028.1 hypothetical protein G6F54_012306 [Rhizopus delemar]KAG1496945.1 hypothetical protein G6F53_012071 [Rhizopus delemar]KAG1519149.1 hypothetical protein G6F52_008902 [Rhizopus delemar]
MSAQIFKDYTRPLIMSEDETKEKIAELVGLNKPIVQNIKARIDDYGSPLPHRQIGRPLKINERTERHLKRIIRKDHFASFKEINVELAKLNVLVSIEALRSYVDRLDFKSYRASHKPRLTARHRKSKLRWPKEDPNWTEDHQWRSVVWSDELRLCMKGSKRGKRVLKKEGERYDEINMISTIKGFEYWPAQSPDLNPIEHVWNALERRIERKRSSVKNLEQLKVALREKWERMDDEFTDQLVRNMKRRCEAVIKAKGGVTEC